MPDAEVFVVQSEAYVYAEDEDTAIQRVRDHLSDITPERIRAKATPTSGFPPLTAWEEGVVCDWCEWWKDRGLEDPEDD